LLLSLTVLTDGGIFRVMLLGGFQEALPPMWRRLLHQAFVATLYSDCVHQTSQSLCCGNIVVKNFLLLQHKM